MRPKSIAVFEILSLGTVALGILQTYLNWDQLTKLAGVGFTLIVGGFTCAIMIVLILSVSRGRSRVVKWILIALFVLGLPGYFAMLSRDLFSSAEFVSCLQGIGQIVALGMLFAPSARVWLNHSKSPARADAA